MPVSTRFWLILAIFMLIQGPRYSNVGKYIFLIYLKLSNFIYKKFSDLKDKNIISNEKKNSPKNGIMLVQGL
jgi:hypothetical protein